MIIWLFLAYGIVGCMYGVYGVKIHQLNYHKQAQWYRLLATFYINLTLWPLNILKDILLFFGYKPKAKKKTKNKKPKKK